MSLENVKINSPNPWFSNSGPERSRFPRGPERPLEDADKKTLTQPPVAFPPHLYHPRAGLPQAHQQTLPFGSWQV